MTRTVVLSRPILMTAALALLLVALAAIPVTREAIGTGAQRAFQPVMVADPSAVAAQRGIAERAIGRAYVQANDQLKKTRELHLVISDAQANAIQARYVAQLRQVRRQALVSLADSLAIRGAEQTRYIEQIEAVLDRPIPADDGTALLAPRLASIITATTDLCRQVADQGTRELTSAPSASPRP